MGRRTVIDYLIEGKQRGFSDEVLKDDLLDNGFDEQAIDDAFYQLHFQMNLQSRNRGKEVRNASAWKGEFGERSSNNAPSQANTKEKSFQEKKKSEVSHNKGEIEGIKHRGWGLVLILTIITFGIYGIYWLVSTTKELRKNTDSAPSPHWLWFLPGTFIGRVLTAGGFLLGLFGLSSGGFVVIAGYIVLGISSLAILYFDVFYASAINELSGFSKAGIIALWILLPIVAIPVSQVQLNKFADDD